MTIRFLHAWNGYASQDTGALSIAEEQRLVSAGIATFGLQDGFSTEPMPVLKRLFNQGRSPLNKKIMASPPTITGQAAFFQPSGWVVPLASAVLVKVLPANPGPFDPRFGISAPEFLTAIATTSYNDGSIFNVLNSTSPSGYGGKGITIIRWCTDAPYFGMCFRWSPIIMLLCDGEYVSSTPILNPVSGASSNYVSIQHATRKAREYTMILAAGVDFGGIAVGPNDTVWAPSIPDIRIAGEGDSYLQGLGLSFTSSIFAETAISLGADFFCCPLGGTGYVSINGPYPNAQTRISQIIGAHGGKSNVVMISLGINDPIGASLVNGVTNYYKQLRAALPKALFIVTTAWCPLETSGPSYSVDRTIPIFAAVRAVGGPYILIDNIKGTVETSWGGVQGLGNLPWQTGVGRVGTPTGAGNGDVYVSSDGTHPSAVGYDYLGYRVWTAIAIALKSFNT